MNPKKTALLLLFCLGISDASAQYSVRDSTLPGALIHAYAGYHLPGADLADRFGNNFSAGAGVLGKLRNSIFFGLSATFLTGGKVKEDTILNGISTADGRLIGSQGVQADISLQERGFNIQMHAGKLFPWIGPNPNSGVLFLAGVGILQHKIRIEYLQNEANNIVPALEGDYRKGYDRLSNGVSISEFVAYLNSSNNKLVNFYVGFEAIQAFTQNRRDWNLDAGAKDAQPRLDLMFGLKFGWYFPIYRQHKGKVFYF